MSRHWLLMFRPETYALIQGHHTIGALAGHRERFAKLDVGDRFVAYVSRVQELDAYGRIVSKPFTSTDAIFGPKSERYAHRARIELEKTGLHRNAKQLLYGLSAFEGRLSTIPTNLLFCMGGFMEITPEDHEWLVGCMERRIQPEWEDAAHRPAGGP